MTEMVTSSQSFCSVLTIRILDQATFILLILTWMEMMIFSILTAMHLTTSLRREDHGTELNGLKKRGILILNSTRYATLSVHIMHGRMILIMTGILISLQ